MRSFLFLLILALTLPANSYTVVNDQLVPVVLGGAKTYNRQFTILCSDADDPRVENELVFQGDGNQTKSVFFTCGQPTFISIRAVVGFIPRDIIPITGKVNNIPQPQSNATQFVNDTEIVENRRRLLGLDEKTMESRRENATAHRRKLMQLNQANQEIGQQDPNEGLYKFIDTVSFGGVDIGADQAGVYYGGQIGGLQAFQVTENSAGKTTITGLCTAFLLGTGFCQLTAQLANRLQLDALQTTMQKANNALNNLNNNLGDYINSVSDLASATHNEILATQDLILENKNQIVVQEQRVQLIEAFIDMETNATRTNINNLFAYTGQIESSFAQLNIEMSNVSIAAVKAIGNLYNATVSLGDEAVVDSTDLLNYKRAVSGSFATLTRFMIETSQKVAERRALIPGFQASLSNVTARGFIPFVYDAGQRPGPSLSDADPTRLANVDVLHVYALESGTSTMSSLGIAHHHSISFQWDITWAVLNPAFTGTPTQFYTALGGGCATSTANADDTGCVTAILIQAESCLLASGVTLSGWQATPTNFSLNSTQCTGGAITKEFYLVYKSPLDYFNDYLQTKLCGFMPQRWLGLDPTLSAAPDHFYRVYSERQKEFGRFSYNSAACKPDPLTLELVTDADPTLSPPLPNEKNVVYAINAMFGLSLQLVDGITSKDETTRLGSLPSPVSSSIDFFVRQPGENEYGTRMTITSVAISPEMVPVFKYIQQSLTIPFSARNSNGAQAATATQSNIQFNWVLKPIMFTIGQFGGQPDQLNPGKRVLFDANEDMIVMTGAQNPREGKLTYLMAPPLDWPLQGGWNLTKWDLYNPLGFDALQARHSASFYATEVVDSAKFLNSSWQNSTFKGCINVVTGEARLCSILNFFDVDEPDFGGLAEWDATCQCYLIQNVGIRARDYYYYGTLSVPDGPWLPQLVSQCPQVVSSNPVFGGGYDIAILNSFDSAITVQMSTSYSPSCPGPAPTPRRITVAGSGTAFNVRIPACGTSNATVSFSRILDNGDSIVCNGSTALDMSRSLLSVNLFADLANGDYVRATSVTISDSYYIAAATLLKNSIAAQSLTTTAPYIARTAAGYFLNPDDFEALRAMSAQVTANGLATIAELDRIRNASMPQWDDALYAAYKANMTRLANETATIGAVWDAKWLILMAAQNASAAALQRLGLTGTLTIAALNEWASTSIELNQLVERIFRSLLRPQVIPGPPPCNFWCRYAKWFYLVLAILIALALLCVLWCCWKPLMSCGKASAAVAGGITDAVVQPTLDEQKQQLKEARAAAAATTPPKPNQAVPATAPNSGTAGQIRMATPTATPYEQEEEWRLRSHETRPLLTGVL